MAPFRLFTSNAIALHQLAIATSALVLGFTTYVAVREATRSMLPENARAAREWPAVLAAICAIYMPWRITELSHLQLTSVQFFPIVWWWTLRTLHEDVPVRVSVGLALCTAIQLLSSFYLAYFLTLSTGVLILVAGFATAERRRRLPRLAASLAPAYALFGVTALPYLTKRASDVLAVGWDSLFSLQVAGAWHLIAPRWPHGAPEGPGLNGPAVYDVPIAVALLGLLALSVAVRHAVSPRAASAPPSMSEVARSATLSFAAIAAVGFVFSIGGSMEVAGLRIPLPSYFFSLVVPGFDMLRGPARWSILVGLAFPLLCGIGLAWLEVRLAGAARWASRAGVCGLVAISLDLFQIPVAPAWPAPEVIAKRAEAIRALPDPAAAVIELPIGSGLAAGAKGSSAVLASTLHWRPMLNGYTGHDPPSYAFLRNLTLELPTPRAVDWLRRLTGVRWALIDIAQTPQHELAAWNRAARSGQVRTHQTVAGLRIVDLAPANADPLAAGSWTQALIDPTPRSSTFAGLARHPLKLTAPAGEIELRRRGPMHGAVDSPVEIRIRNRSGVIWPGFDNQREGLVLLRYTVAPADASADERAYATRLALLKQDVAPAAITRVRTLLRPPRPVRSGAAELCVDLVQWLGGKLVALPIAPARQPVQLLRRSDPGGLQELIARYALPRSPLPACGT